MYTTDPSCNTCVNRKKDFDNFPCNECKEIILYTDTNYYKLDIEKVKAEEEKSDFEDLKKELNFQIEVLKRSETEISFQGNHIMKMIINILRGINIGIRKI